MIIGSNGPITQDQLDTQAREAAEAKRIKSLTNAGLAGDLRRARRTIGKTNPLADALALVCLVALKRAFPNDRGLELNLGNDPYLCRTSRRPKMGRQRKK